MISEARPTPIRLAITGSRHYTDAPRLNAVLWAIHRQHGIACILEGECPTEINADKMARDWAEANGIPVERFPVDHAVDGPWPGAGPRRSARMLRDGRAERLLAFPEPAGGWGRGTMACVRCAWGMGVPVWRVTDRAVTIWVPEPPKTEEVSNVESASSGRINQERRSE